MIIFLFSCFPYIVSRTYNNIIGPESVSGGRGPTVYTEKSEKREFFFFLRAAAVYCNGRGSVYTDIGHWGWTTTCLEFCDVVVVFLVFYVFSIYYSRVTRQTETLRTSYNNTRSERDGQNSSTDPRNSLISILFYYYYFFFYYFPGPKRINVTHTHMFTHIFIRVRV